MDRNSVICLWKDKTTTCGYVELNLNNKEPRQIEKRNDWSILEYLIQHDQLL